MTSAERQARQRRASSQSFTTGNRAVFSAADIMAKHRGKEQAPKTDNAIREIDIPKSLATLLKASVGSRGSGFLFQSESGRPLTQRNVSRDGLGKIQKDMQLEKGKAFHAFRRFRTAHLRKNRVPWDLQKLWLGLPTKMSRIGMQSS
jgi:integrase